MQSILDRFSSFFKQRLRSSLAWPVILPALLTIFILPRATCTPAPDTGKLFQAIGHVDRTAQAYLRASQEPGMAIGILAQGKPAFLRGYGVQKIGQRQAITPDTVFQLGSVSKPISATLIAILQAKGFLHIQDRLTPYIPQATPFASDTSLRIWHVLSHTSGWPRYGFNQQIEAFKTRQTILRNLGNTAPLSKPGSRYDYHNVAFSLVENMLESKFQLPFEYLLQTRIFKPLGMRNSSSNYESLLQQRNKAWPHAAVKRHKSYRHKRASNRYVPYASYSQAYYDRARAAAGINSTAVDMLRFLQLQAGAWPGILPRSVLSVFHSPHVRSPESLSAVRGFFPGKKLQAGYALGWRTLDIQGLRVVYHGGWLKGFTNFMAFVPEWGIGIVILHHAESRIATQLGLQFIQQLTKPTQTVSAKRIRKSPPRPNKPVRVAMPSQAGSF